MSSDRQMDLRVSICVDGRELTFTADGDGPLVVAAFRAWLASEDCAIPSALGVDEVDRIAAVMLASAETIRLSRQAVDEGLAREGLMAEALGVGHE